MPKTLSSFFVGCIVLLISNFAIAEIYQWRDSQGRAHFTDQQPIDSQNYQRLILRQTNTFQPQTIEYEDETDSDQSDMQEARVAYVHEQTQLHLNSFCGKAEDKYLGLMGRVSLFQDRPVIRSNGKVITRREQNELAEGYRQRANDYGCKIAQI